MPPITPQSYPTKFSWPLRIFLFALLFDMAAHALLMLTRIEDKFIGVVERYPEPLPTPAERRRIDAGEHPDGFTTYSGRLWHSAKGVAVFLSPEPSEEAAEKIETVGDVFRYAAAWYKTRADFLSKSVGIDQNWSMFSPNVGTEDTMGRCRLIYEDGSEVIHYPVCDPVDPCRYSHWFEEKHIQMGLAMSGDRDTRLGYCNWLSHRYPKNAAGSPLKSIVVFKVQYFYPSVDDDPAEFLRRQTGPPEKQVREPFWRYDVKTKRGEYL